MLMRSLSEFEEERLRKELAMEYLKTIWATKKGKLLIIAVAIVVVGYAANQAGLTN